MPEPKGPRNTPNGERKKPILERVPTFRDGTPDVGLAGLARLLTKVAVQGKLPLRVLSPREIALASMTRCERCGDEAVGAESSNLLSKPFKRARHGFCAPCVVCNFFQVDGDHGIGFSLPPDFDPEGLKLPHIQKQFSSILKMGCSELTAEQIDWDKVIEKWELKEQAK